MMPTMNRFKAIIVGIAVSAAPLTILGQQPPSSPAQPPPQQQQEIPTFRTGANLVRVDATVLDKSGNPVPALSAEDFDIEEDGLRQTISSLKFVEANGQQTPGDDISLTIRSPEHAAAEAARDDVRVFLILWDEYHIDPLGGAIRAKDAITRFVTTMLQPTDLVAVMDQLTPTDAIRFTRDFSDLALDIHKLTGRLGVFIPTRSAAEDEQLAKAGDIRRVRSEVSLSALKAGVVFLGTLREGRKSVIFVSQGLGGLGRDATNLLSDTVRAANESNTAIYALDPRGLMGPVSESLYVLAENTGGATIGSSNDLTRGLRQVVRESSAYYLIGYSSIKNPADGKFHQIKVSMKRPGLEVRARKGYWAPSAKTVSDAKAAAAAAVAPDGVTASLTALAPATSRRVLDVWTGVSRNATGGASLSLAWSRRGTPAVPDDDPAMVSVSVRAGDDVLRFDGPVDGDGPTFAVPPGNVTVQTVVRGRDERTIDTDTRVVEVPDFAAARLVWSSAMIHRVRTPLELRAMAAGPAPHPFAGRDFTRTDRLFLRLALYDAGAGPAVAVAGRLVSRTGRTLTALPVALLPGRPGTYQIDLALQSVAPGDYVIAIEASRGADKVESVHGDPRRLLTAPSPASRVIRGASPLGLPDTLSRAPRRRRAPLAWLARGARSHLATGVRFMRRLLSFTSKLVNHRSQLRTWPKCYGAFAMILRPLPRLLEGRERALLRVGPDRENSREAKSNCGGL